MQVWSLLGWLDVMNSEYAWKLGNIFPNVNCFINFPCLEGKQLLVTLCYRKMAFTDAGKTCVLLDRVRVWLLLVLLAAATAPPPQPIPLPFSDVAVLCKPSDLVFQLCNMNNCNTPRTSCIPSPRNALGICLSLVCCVFVWSILSTWASPIKDCLFLGLKA